MLRKLLIFNLLLSALLGGFQIAAAQQSRQLSQENNEKRQKRLALVIGNGDYDWARKLLNPVNDATDMAAALKELDFEVILGTNLTLKQMSEKVVEFSEKLKSNGGVGLFYYAGHGVQVNRKNYLVPIEAEIPNKEEIESAALNLDLVLSAMGAAKNGSNIVILDAGRKNPFALVWGSGNFEDGLAQVNAPEGTFIAYAASPNRTIPDGEGRNGFYMTEILKQIKKPDIKIEEVFRQINAAVERETSGTQAPWTASSMRGEFYFKPVKLETTVAATPVVVPTPAASIDASTSNAVSTPVVTSTPNANPPSTVKSDSTNLSDTKSSQAEKESWDLVKDSADEEDFRMYLKEFPKGANAETALARLEQILWNKAKTANDKAKIQAYLKEFPEGTNAPTARIKLRQLETRESVDPVKETPTSAQGEVKPKATTTPTASATTPTPVKTKSKTTTTAASSKNMIRTNSIGMELVYIPPGSFMMGSSERQTDESYRFARKEYADVETSWFDHEKPQRMVTFNEGFWMGKTEVTQAQWAEVMGENPSNFKGCDDCPVERVSWQAAKMFIQKLNAQNDGFEYRLPSESEWEYAARAGTTGLFAGPIDEMSWNNGNSETKTHPVGTKRPNAFGLYDMYGNVAEWCEDNYSPTYDGLPVDGSANTSIGDNGLRVLRGGSWANFPSLSRSASRDKYRQENFSIVIGFRIAARLK